ncbi:hypothetical protein [Sulfobacillus sp. hq2]|uniref:hypothetical protein n=1 Tax=Sulfobacillus TaxID=28033 RepID=UPI000CD1DDB0|nr:hypothetical protein [Sulfobacillus sp. hq2]POB11711.1 hypothetical protein CO251_03840 [Sulfobacillus sp. hq2]
MARPLSWVPVLDVSHSAVTPFTLRQISVFVRSHNGYGHVLTRSPLPQDFDCPSWTYTAAPIQGPWRMPNASVLVGKLEDPEMDIMLEIPANNPDRSPALIDLASCTAMPGCRWIVYRKPGVGAMAASHAILRLASLYPHASLWLDQPSIGWDLAAYLLAADDRLQLLHIPDQELSQLVDIATALQRPIMLHDFGPHKALPVMALPQHAFLPPVPSSNMTSLPVYPGYL